MDWSEAASEFPAPRDDDPAHLRQDIHDELADHLQSALERELRLSTDETAAREQVLAKFGDPRRVARKLWQDAMWEKLMSQRMQMVATGLMLMTCVGMFWMTSTIASQGRAMNEAMLVRLDAIAKQSTIVPVNPEWNPVSVQLVPKSGEPLPEGYTVHMSCGGDPVSHAEPVDRASRADFGAQRPGRYGFSVQTPWGEHSDGFQKWVRAGSPLHVEIVCPTSPDRLDAPLTINWPKSFDNPDYCLVCEIRTSRRTLNGLEWGRTETRRLFVDHSGRHMYADPTLYNFVAEAPRGNGGAVAYAAAPAPTFTAPPTLTTATTYRVPADLSANDKLSLPEYSEGTATVIILRIQPGDGEYRIATPIGKPLQVPLALQHESTPCWTLMLPQNIDADAEKTADAKAISSRTAIR